MKPGNVFMAGWNEAEWFVEWLKLARKERK